MTLQVPKLLMYLANFKMTASSRSWSAHQHSCLQPPFVVSRSKVGGWRA